MSVCCYTSFSFTYFSRAQVLSETLRRAHPDWTLCAVIVDRPPAGIDAHTVTEFFDIVLEPEDLGIPNVRAWLFKHDVVEACTAVKGHALIRLLGNFEKVIYLDPDIAVFHPLDRVVEHLEKASILLVPHQTQPNDTELAIWDNEGASLKYGIFNLGFLAVRNDAPARSFAKWWAGRLYQACYDDTPKGIFTDQKYCDLVPALFEGVMIDRDAGLNVASWNLSQRKIEIGHDGVIRVNGSELKFMHFTKIGSDGDHMIERYAGDNIQAFEIWRWYKKVVFKAGRPNAQKGYWHYGCFSNGVKISREVRLFYRSRPDLMEHFFDPFEAREGSLYEWLQHEVPNLVLADKEA